MVVSPPKHVDAIVDVIQDGGSIPPASTTKQWGRQGIDWLRDAIAACGSWNQGYLKMVPLFKCRGNSCFGCLSSHEVCQYLVAQTGTFLFLCKECYMPTNNEEAVRICSIINEFIDATTAKKITARLYEEVGKSTENESLSISLKMLKTLYDQHTGE
tara:strand:+ start:155 stop:625 length:471 start_codon:yes stop_codon:yes gene_type:complete